jgi:hypothetical protein
MATPAFPRSFSLDTREAFDDSIAHPAHTGITIQDYFAAKALQGMLAEPSLKATPEEFAQRAYIIADAMIKARSEA